MTFFSRISQFFLDKEYHLFKTILKNIKYLILAVLCELSAICLTTVIGKVQLKDERCYSHFWILESVCAHGGVWYLFRPWSVLDMEYM